MKLQLYKFWKIKNRKSLVFKKKKKKKKKTKQARSIKLMR